MKKLLSLLSVTVLLAACSTGDTAMDDGPITVGLITPLTGEVASLGADIANGAQLRVEEVNAAGGINGRQVEIIAEDGRCSGVDAASAAQKLVNLDQVVAIHGAGCSGESLAAAPIAEAAGVVMITPSSTSPDVTDAGDYIFRAIPSDALKSTSMAEYFAEQGYTKVAMIGENTDFCGAFRTSLMNDFGADNFVFDEVVEPGTKDFRSLMARLQDTDFDVFVLNAQTPAVGAAMIQQMRELSIEQPAIGHDIIDTLNFVELAGEAADGVLAINVPAIADDGAFGQKFTAAYGAPQASMSWGAYGYDTMAVLLQAIAEAGTDGDAIRDYLYGMSEYDGVVGPISFDENGDVEKAFYELKQVTDGGYVKISDITVD